MNYLNNVTIFSDEESRCISPENLTGIPGGACHASGVLGPGRKGNGSICLPTGEETTIAHITGPGVIRHFWMTVRNLSELGGFVLRDLVLRIYWDDSELPAVESPLGDFFCNGFGERCDIDSLPIVVNPVGGMNCYFEMPFMKSARFTITNEHPKDITSFFYTINYAIPKEIDPNHLYFHAYWRRDWNTTPKQDYVLIDDIAGYGYYVGTYLAITALSRYWWGEGEFKFYIDSDKEYPSISSTGTEDYFGGAWAFHHKRIGNLPTVTNFSKLFTGYPFYSRRDSTRDFFEKAKLNDMHSFGDDALPMHGLYRWHLPDPIAFHSGIRVTLQQIGNDDIGLFERSDDICSVAYWYQDSPNGICKPFPERKLRLPR